MIRHIHHPSCPAAAPSTAPAPLSRLDKLWADEAARCICPPAEDRRRA